MVFNLYILIISNLLVSRTPLITVLSTEGLSWVNIPFIYLFIYYLEYTSHRCSTTVLLETYPYIPRKIQTGSEPSRHEYLWDYDDARTY